MFWIWVIGIAVILALGAFLVGMEGTTQSSDEAEGCLGVVVLALTWPVSVPLLLLYFLGRYFRS